MPNGHRPAFHYTKMEELYQLLPSENVERLNEFSRLTGVTYGSVYYPYLVCCEYYLYLLTTLLNSFPNGQQIELLMTLMKNYEDNIITLGERVEVAMQGVIDASNPNGVARRLAIACAVCMVTAFAGGAAVGFWARTNGELTAVAHTSAQAKQIYYLNQDAISDCQQRFKSKSGVISCPDHLVVPSQW